MNPAGAGVQGGGWHFAVSGDSRDCGDLIMPKIARSIVDRRAETPVQFYWHLGDYRALYRIDCDIAKSSDPDFNCTPTQRSQGEINAAQKRQYLKTAWPDFIRSQLAPFQQGEIQVFLGIGNHEVGTFKLGDGVQQTFTRDDYRSTFSPWLRRAEIEAQRKADAKRAVLQQPLLSYNPPSSQAITPRESYS